MSFGAPGYLALLLIAAGCAGLVVWWSAWRAGAAARFGPFARERFVARASTLAVPVLLLAALALTAFAAARPQAGSDEALFEDRGIDLVVVLDVSQSMMSTDVESTDVESTDDESTDAEPTRLGQAQAETDALLDRMTGDRVGLVIFAGAPFVRSPLTSDLRSLGVLVDGVEQERGLVSAGSDLGRAIRTAQEVLAGGEAATKAMLIISDGEDHGTSIAEAVEEARGAGIRVYTAGVGTSGGAPVRDVDAVTGQLVERFDESGALVITRLDAVALGRIAEAGGGRYVELGGDSGGLADLAAEFDSLARTTFDAGRRSQPIERFQIFAGVALGLAVAATLLPAAVRMMLRRGRARLGLLPLAGAGLLVGAVCSSGVADLNREGNERYVGGDYPGAVESYREAQDVDPARDELYYNAGNALARRGEFQAAVEEAQRALPADESLEALVEYASGNHYAGASMLREALEAYKRSLLAEPGDADAKHNLEVISRRLDATPSPTPTPPLPTPIDAPDSSDDDGSQTGGLTPTPGAGGPGGLSTPDPGEDGSPVPGDPDELTDEQRAIALAEALRGIDSDFTVEEALRALDLLAEENRRQLEQPRSGNPTGAPDY
ncbi:MAG: VWA domain-containing protein [Dehalococcoidia bacterium]